MVGAYWVLMVRMIAQEVVTGTLGAGHKIWDHRTRLEADHWTLQFCLPPQHMAALAKLSPGAALTLLDPVTLTHIMSSVPPRLPAETLALQRHHHIL